MIHIDPTIRLGDVILVVGGIVAFLKMFTGVRDSMRDLANAVGSKLPREGLLGEVEALKEDTREHRDWLIDMRAKLGFKA